MYPMLATRTDSDPRTRQAETGDPSRTPRNRSILLRKGRPPTNGDNMTLNAAALLAAVALIAGWHGARFHRALKDLAGAKEGVDKARKVLGVERRPFLVIAGIVFILIWWWLHKHGG